MNENRKNWHRIVECADSDQITLDCKSKKRRTAINYINDRCLKVESFLFTANKINTLVSCVHEYKKQIGQLINETNFELNGELFDD